MIAENTPESALLVTDTQLSVQAQGPGVVAMPPATTIEEYDREQALVQHIMGQMQEDKDYGLIPGTRKKTLYEPGAEALRRAFRIVWKYRCLDKVEDFERMEFYYHIEAYQLLAPGVEGIAWEASAWSREKKFNGMEREMLHHNVRDRAIKRAFVALIRNIAAASGEFDPGGAIKATDDDALICSDHGVPFLYHAEGRYGPFYSHTGPKHNVGERKIAEFTQAPTRGPENGREQGGEVEADPQEVTVE